MTVRLPDHLDLIASAPDGIRKLRGLILELAVRGKLVAQDPNDEPASELLKRIAKERARLEAEGTCKKSKATAVEEVESPVFVVATGWVSTSLGEVVEIVRGITFPSSEKSKTPEAGRVRCLRTANVQDKIEWGDILYIRSEFVSRDDQMLRPNDIVMSMANSRELVGKVALVESQLEEPATFGGFLGVLRPHLILPRFVMAFLRAPTVRSSLIDSASQTTNIANISLAKLRPLNFPIPPLAEQHRIVAKIDELMALCDRLEAEQADADSAQIRLVETLLGTLTRSTDAADLAANWQRLAEHFATLFTSESSLDALKQTILQLAVMGKLVAQDSKDEAAVKLLKRIRGSRQFKRKFSTINVESMESPLPEIPVSWIWTVIDQVACDSDNAITDGPFGANLKTEHYISAPGCRVIRLQNIGPGIFRAEHQAYVDSDRFDRLPKHHVFAGDLVVAGLVDERVRCCKLPTDIGKALVKADCYRLAVHELLSTEYALYYLNSPIASVFASAHHHGMTLTRIGLGNFRQLPFPLPPLAEQHRIVARVDELLALCDRLKADLAASRARQERLSTTLIESALQAA